MNLPVKSTLAALVGLAAFSAGSQSFVVVSEGQNPGRHVRRDRWPEPDASGTDQPASGRSETASAASLHGAQTFKPLFPLFHRRGPHIDVDPSYEDPQPTKDGAIELLLTFDDGPSLTTTPQVLDILDSSGAKAIFFVAGHMLVGQHPEDRARRNLVRKIAARGHMVANHSVNHKDLCAEPSSIEYEIDGNEEILAAATGVRPRLFRSPYGSRCEALTRALRDRNLLNLGWNVDPQEWRHRDRHSIAEAVISQIKGLKYRGIVLLHDTKRSTVGALPLVFDWIRKENRRAADPGRHTGSRPIRIVDYAVFLPKSPVPPSGLEPLVHRLAKVAHPLLPLDSIQSPQTDVGMREASAFSAQHTTASRNRIADSPRN